MDNIEIRAYQTVDLAAVEALEARVKPYRPEDQAAVQAMYARAARAESEQDPRWMASPPDDPPAMPERYAAFWVAEQKMANGTGRIVGTVAVTPFRVGVEMALTHPLAQAWDGRSDVIELRRVRVALEVRRQGVGTRLCLEAIVWARALGYALFVANTTTPQTLALQLYQRLGFQLVDISFIDQYELVWSALKL